MQNYSEFPKYWTQVLTMSYAHKQLIFVCMRLSYCVCFSLLFSACFATHFAKRIARGKRAQQQEQRTLTRSTVEASKWLLDRHFTWSCFPFSSAAHIAKKKKWKRKKETYLCMCVRIISFRLPKWTFFYMSCLLVSGFQFLFPMVIFNAAHRNRACTTCTIKRTQWGMYIFWSQYQHFKPPLYRSHTVHSSVIVVVCVLNFVIVDKIYMNNTQFCCCSTVYNIKKQIQLL